MKKFLSVLLVAFLCAGAWSCLKNDDEQVDNTNAVDAEFMQKATAGNKAEIAAGAVAVNRAMMDSVKFFGRMMVDDHSMSQGILDSIAATLSVNLPAGPDSMHMMQLQQLSMLEGHVFDSVYLAMQANDHQAAIDLYNREAAQGAHYGLRQYAEKQLPVLHKHYDMVIRLSHVR